jgi:hypothetical protein
MSDKVTPGEDSLTNCHSTPACKQSRVTVVMAELTDSSDTPLTVNPAPDLTPRHCSQTFDPDNTHQHYAQSALYPDLTDSFIPRLDAQVLLSTKHPTMSEKFGSRRSIKRSRRNLTPAPTEGFIMNQGADFTPKQATDNLHFLPQPVLRRAAINRECLRLRQKSRKIHDTSSIKNNKTSCKQANSRGIIRVGDENMLVMVGVGVLSFMLGAVLGYEVFYWERHLRARKLSKFIDSQTDELD